MYVGEANSRFAAFASLMLILPPALLLWINKVVLLKKM
jgi:putative spermidine/putrescine transport system permease protein